MSCLPSIKTTCEDLDSDDDEVNALEKSRELFDYCDSERKGYLTNKDLQGLKEDLSLTDAQLNEVFDSLDENHDGRLEIDEFSEGFGMFVAIAANHSDRKRAKKLSLAHCRALSPIRELTSDPYEEFLDQIECRQFGNDELLRSMWLQISEKHAGMMPDFENFLIKAGTEMENAKDDCTSLQSAFSAQRNENDQHLRQLYEKLEKKMAAEKANRLAEECAKIEKTHQQLEEEVKHKNELLTSMRNEHDSMKDKIFQLRAEEASRRRQNAQLEKERSELERKLRTAENLRLDVESECKKLSEECLKTKRRREKSASCVSSELSLEEELIAVEIKQLQNENKFLLDKKDFMDACDNRQDNNDVEFSNDRSDAVMAPGIHLDRDEINRRGSSLYEYLHQNESFPDETSSFEAAFENSLNIFNATDTEAPTVSVESLAVPHPPSESNYHITWKVTCKMIVNDVRGFQKYWKVKMICVPTFQQKMMHRMLNCNIITEAPTPAIEKYPFMCQQELVYKIIFIGDCGVGKTSFIQRFCDNTFRSTFQSTIGMDFQEKEITVNGHRTLLKLWDTAGQERFRSICKQYFRNVDGAIVMYDVTNEESYQNVRRWMDSIKENNEEGIVILLVGNKTDARNRRVQSLVGAQLAKEYGAAFFETSVKTGANVQKAMVSLAISLQRKSYRSKEKRFHLKEPSLKEVKKKWWC